MILVAANCAGLMFDSGVDMANGIVDDETVGSLVSPVDGDYSEMNTDLGDPPVSFEFVSLSSISSQNKLQTNISNSLCIFTIIFASILQLFSI